MKVALLSVCDMLHVVVETRTSHDRQDHPVTEPGQGSSGGGVLGLTLDRGPD